mmetsp:Transcript_26700/g.80477  ORF Transcript_26700/g.80477 Transcript_26700/m.80477 type:complete len:216 (-) Transcript_26700:342-989(-)
MSNTTKKKGHQRSHPVGSGAGKAWTSTTEANFATSIGPTTAVSPMLTTPLVAASKSARSLVEAAISSYAPKSRLVAGRFRTHATTCVEPGALARSPTLRPGLLGAAAMAFGWTSKLSAMTSAYSLWRRSTYDLARAGKSMCLTTKFICNMYSNVSPSLAGGPCKSAAAACSADVVATGTGVVVVITQLRGPDNTVGSAAGALAADASNSRQRPFW